MEIPMTTELSTKWRFEQISEKLSIEKTTYYNRLKFLEIEPNKDSEGTYLSTEQMEVMEELSQHIRETGKMKGFRCGGELALSESSGLASGLDIPVQPDIPGDDDEDGLEQLIREAAELKVQQAAMPDLVRLHLAAGMTEDDLPDDLKAKLQAVREAANPKQSAASIAQQLLQRHRQNQEKK
jgi:hypothetical protein